MVGYAMAFLACLDFQCNRCDQPHGFKVCSPIHVCLPDFCLADKHMSLRDPAEESELTVRVASYPRMLQWQIQHAVNAMKTLLTLLTSGRLEVTYSPVTAGL